MEAEWSWAAEPANVSLARHAVMGFLREHAVPDPPLNDAGLIVSEAVTNTVNHAYTDRVAGEVRVRAAIEGSRLELVVEDDGRGLQPRTDSPGVGLGLPLIAALSDRVLTDTSPGTGTRMAISFSWAAG